MKAYDVNIERVTGNTAIGGNTFTLYADLDIADCEDRMRNEDGRSILVMREKTMREMHSLLSKMIRDHDNWKAST